jgi:hypothetical protein
VNVDRILDTLNRHGVDYLLIGGMNFLLRHAPVLTFDVDVWIRDTPANRLRCAEALDALGATWGEQEATWGPTRNQAGDWLARRGVFCLLTSEGPLDIFRSVRGLSDWAQCAGQAVDGRTAAGTAYRGLSDSDMLACQLALDEGARKLDRVRTLQEVLRQSRRHDAE